MKRLVLSIVLGLLCFSTSAKISKDTTSYYHEAFEELQLMLKGEIPISIKRAVFITENAYLENQIRYEDFNMEIQVLVTLAQSIIDDDIVVYNQSDKEIIEKSAAIFKVLKGETDFIIPHDTTFLTVKWKPFGYDMEDFWGEKNWVNTFVSKALVTHSGNCHSLPLLYKILAEEFNIPAYLSIAPNHTYIKQWSKKSGWFNTELTNGSFPFDPDIKHNSYIKTQAVAKGIYMDTLSNKQSVAYIITDLAQGYLRKFGYEDVSTPIQWLDLALKYYPNYINALILKAELQKKLFEHRMKYMNAQHFHETFNDNKMKKEFKSLEEAYYNIHTLGYRRMPKEMYLNWLFRVNKDTIRSPHRFTTPQPFSDYDYDVHVATAGDGQNYEFYDQDTIARIGTVEINTLNGTILNFIEYDYAEEIPDEIISRMYDPALGRFWQVDPLADIAADRTPYHFVSNDPINRIDPTGLTDFKINEETGEVEQVGEINDEPDRILQTDKNGNVKKKGEGLFGFLVKEEKRGEVKVAADDIEQGFLRNGMNLRTESNVFEVGGEGQPTLDGFEDFALKISNYIDKEVDGAYLSNKNGTDIRHVYMAGYENNDSQNARGGFNLHKYRPSLVGNTDVRELFHTHLSRFGDSDRLAPSSIGPYGGDIGYKKRQSEYNPHLKFRIITNPKSFTY